MKSLCITGAAGQNLAMVAAVLRNAGMRDALPAKRPDEIDLAYWHTQVIAQAQAELDSGAKEEQEDGGDLPAQQQLLQTIDSPGRLWDQLAADIFLANIDAPLWGWSDSRSVWLLDYWLQFEPRLNFVLVCNTPSQILAEAMSSSADSGGLNVPALMDDWYSTHEQLLRFYHRNPTRCLLVSAADVAANPATFVKQANKRWRLRLAKLTQEAMPRIEPGALARYLAHEIASRYPHTRELCNELDATLIQLGKTVPAESPQATADSDLVANYLALIDRSAEAGQIEKLQSESAEANKQKEVLMSQLALLQEENKALELKRESAQKQIAALQSELSEAGRENELLLLQLHQVQEELEALFLKHEATQKQLAEITLARDQQAKFASERQAQIVQLFKNRDEQTALSTQRQQQIEALNAARAALEKDKTSLTLARDTQSKLANERQTQLDAMRKAMDVLEREKTALAQRLAAGVENKAQTEALKAAEANLKAADARSQAAENKLKTAEAQLKAIESKLATAETRANLAEGKFSDMEVQTGKLKDAEQENELLLLQLHQVQEELEHYFLQQQEAQKQLKIADERWQRMLQRNPGYTEFGSVELIPHSGAEAGIYTWCINDTNIAGRNFKALRFATVTRDGITGLIFKRGDDVLKFWPSGESDVLSLIPAGSHEEIRANLLRMLTLSTSDWSLVRGLLNLVQKAAAAPGALQVPLEFSLAGFASGVERLQLAIERLPDTLRYDTLSLKREQVNPDYEHLWLKFDNLSVGNQQWPHVEFRLSCAHVAPNAFGNFPKLEFPEEGRAPFAGWYAESNDDFGSKLELRFDVRHGIDVAVWRKLPEADRHFVMLLLRELPRLLGNMQTQGLQLTRSWSDWITQAQTMQNLLHAATKQEASIQPDVSQQVSEPSSRSKKSTSNKRKSR